MTDNDTTKWQLLAEWLRCRIMDYKHRSYLDPDERAYLDALLDLDDEIFDINDRTKTSEPT